MERIHNFKSFSQLKTQLREEATQQQIAVKLQSAGSQYGELLKKYNATSPAEISEEQLPEFIAELMGEAKEASDKAAYDRNVKAIAFAKELKAKKDKAAKAASLTRSANRYNSAKESMDESVVEALSSEQKMVETFLKKVAKEFDYSTQDAARFVKETISKMGLDEAKVSEGNAFGAARAKAIADGEEEFEVDGEKYPVTSVDAEDKENAEEFVSEGAKEEQTAMELYVKLVDPREGEYTQPEMEKMNLSQLEDVVMAQGFKGKQAKEIAKELIKVTKG